MKNSAPFISLTIISIFSLSTIWSTVPDLVINQLTFIFVAVFCAVLFSRLNTRNLQGISLISYLTTVVLLTLTFIMGRATRGSIRWIELGPMRLQPSEISKPLLIIFFASFLSQENVSHREHFTKYLLMLLPPALLIFLQPDLGSTIIVGIIWFGMLLASSIPKKYPLVLATLTILSIPLALNFLQPYQLERLNTFTNPYADPRGSGYNVIQSLIAVGSGQFIGKGVRQGTQSHLKFLPEKHTDFAFASFAEEFGFFGSSLLLLSYAILLLWLISTADDQPKPTNLVVIGVFWYVFTQTLVNSGMNLGIFPVTGITLPFFSYGGSSLLSLGISLGLVFSTLKKSLYAG